MRFQRHHHEEHDTRERWLISYADFVTLLFATFVVLYAMSSLDVDKFRAMAEQFPGQFNVEPKSIKPIQVGPYPGIGGYDPEQVVDLPFPINAQEEEVQKYESEHIGVLDGGADELVQIAGEIRAAFPELLTKELINLGEDQNWLEIEINNELLFQSGVADPNHQAVELITKLAEPLKKFDLPVNIEGFTDDVPILNERFPSNWELSAARAAAIVRILVDTGMDPRRLAAIGYGEFKPVASNTTEDGRKLNRRVVMVVNRPTNRFEETGDDLEIKQGSPDGPVQPVRLPGGGLLFTSEPPADAVPVEK